MRRKYEGYIFQFTLSDHGGGRHIHVFKDNQPLGVYDRIEGAIRNLDKHWNKNLQAGLEKFISELNERGYFLV
jgi:hypothetical protein